MDTDDKLFKFILKCCRNHDKADVHSFWIAVEGGRAFVECRPQEVFIELISYSGRHQKWCGYPMAAATRLESLGARYDTIDM